ncbi:MAG: hypothetical protein HY726_20615 [Candidatus Rokubacteria bacterium]|nr:hypothetical protein [Candidatus Rokubacteria bacterium]
MTRAHEREASGRTRRWWLDDPAVARLEFGLAGETEEFEQAFRLLHDQYVRRGFMDPHPSGWRLSLHNALPSTKVFLARAAGRVVGTVTLIQDSRIGLPMEDVYREELEPLKDRGRRLAEASALALDPGYRASGTAILFRLFRMLLLYAAKIARLDDLCLVATPHHATVYRRWVPFREIGSPRPYRRVNDATVIGLRLELGILRALIRVVRAGLSPGELFDVLVGPEPCRRVFARLRRDLPRSSLTPLQIAHFFARHGPPVLDSPVQVSPTPGGGPSRKPRRPASRPMGAPDHAGVAT